MEDERSSQHFIPFSVQKSLADIMLACGNVSYKMYHVTRVTHNSEADDRCLSASRFSVRSDQPQSSLIGLAKRGEHGDRVPELPCCYKRMAAKLGTESLKFFTLGTWPGEEAYQASSTPLRMLPKLSFHLSWKKPSTKGLSVRSGSCPIPARRGSDLICSRN